MRRIFSALLLFAGLAPSLSAQTTSQAYRDYIEKYKDVAVRQMQTERIPASIIMAQGLLESAAGKSYLAVNANNHFGIKCTSDWTGKTIRKDDDRRDECFRKYEHAEESFRDHSAFLKRERYASLYTLDPTDYKAWAKGLKAAGYATDPLYAEKLIRIIDNYQLHRLDTLAPLASAPTDPGALPGDPVPPGIAGGDLNALYRHANKGMMYAVAFPGDTPYEMAQRFKVPLKKILAYNELRYDSQLVPGQNVFLVQKKTSGADDFYTVQPGDTMYLIAQKTGMTVQSLYTKNRIKPGAMPPAGTRLYLRRTIPRRLAVHDYNL